MSVRFILGRSGSGKTRYCIDAIVHHVASGASARNLVLLVPEQATYQAEKAILSYSGVCPNLACSRFPNFQATHPDIPPTPR